MLYHILWSIVCMTLVGLILWKIWPKGAEEPVNFLDEGDSIPECIIRTCSERACREGTFIRGMSVSICKEHYKGFKDVCQTYGSMLGVDIEWRLCSLIQNDDMKLRRMRG